MKALCSRREIDQSATILSAMQQMDNLRVKSLLVFKEDCFLCLLTIGDIQRAIIADSNLLRPISEIKVAAKEYARTTEDITAVKERMFEMRAECMPVLDEAGKLVKVYNWEEFFKSELMGTREQIDLPVVIMAGGLGTRLKPLTNVLPKPLIPIGEKTILETILDQFSDIGCQRFYMSVNYKAEMIKYYLNSLEKSYNIEFFNESHPMGTIGSVTLLRDKFHGPFFVSNCDILIEQDYREVYDYHIRNRNDITVVAAVKDYAIPYGVVKTGPDGIITKLQEKPVHTFLTNTGVYILNAEIIREIPDDSYYQITDLIEKVRNKGGRVGCFPVSAKAWTDIGDWTEYLKIVSRCS